jgi:hypothetical protein
MTASTQSASQLVLTKHIPSQWGHKMYRNMCLPNPSHDKEDSKYNNKCVDKTPPKPANSENATQHVLTKPLTMPAMTQNVP